MKWCDLEHTRATSHQSGAPASARTTASWYTPQETPEICPLSLAGLAVHKDFPTRTYYNTVTSDGLIPLAQALSKNAHLELHGCSIASGPDGDLFGKELVKQLLCWFWAWTSYQYGLPWVPPVLAFLPNGTVLKTLKPPPLAP